MSTRSTTHFHNGNGPSAAIVYRHSDGYPDGEYGMLAELQRFFNDVKLQTQDTRFNNPSYLAAKWTVWLADKFATKYNHHTGEYTKAALLDFLSVGICLEDPLDIAYRYHVRCSSTYHSPVFPAVDYEKTRSILEDSE